MSNLLGCHYPNANFRNMEAFNSIIWNAFVVLSDQRNKIPELRSNFPNARILVRAYLSNWYATDPVQWANDIAGWWPDCAPYRCELTFANEQNLGGEGHPHADDKPYPPRSVYEDILAWNIKVIPELRRLLPGVILHFPALSQGHSDDEDDGTGYVGFQILGPAVEQCDVLDAHTYWNGAANREDIYYGRRYEKLHSLFPNKEIFISECGSDVDVQNDDGADYAAWLNGLPSYVSAACFFIWDSDANNAGWEIFGKTNIVNGFGKYIPPQKLSDARVAQLILNEKFPDTVTALAVYFAEGSEGDPLAKNTKGNKPPGSVDRGLWQINSYWHKEISDECAFDPVCATHAAYNISAGGTDFSPWTTFKVGAYKKYLPRAQSVIDTIAKPTFEQALISESKKQRKLFNDNTDIYKDAQAKGKGNPESDEWNFVYDGKNYVAQTYQDDIACVLKGDKSVQWIKRQ